MQGALHRNRMEVVWDRGQLIQVADTTGSTVAEYHLSLLHYQCRERMSYSKGGKVVASSPDSPNIYLFNKVSYMDEQLSGP